MRPAAIRTHFEWLPGQADQAVFADRLDRADDLRLLAAHHLRHARGVRRRDAGNQPDVRTLERHRDQTGGEIAGAGRAGQVGRLHPALPAADHPGQQDPRLARGEPGANPRTQRAGETAARDMQDTFSASQAINDPPGAIDPEGAEPAGAPVHADHRLAPALTVRKPFSR